MPTMSRKNTNKIYTNMKLLLERFFILMLLGCLPITNCQAEVFKGKIVNAETGERLVGASISGNIEPQQGWTYISTAETDSTGLFHLSAPIEGRIVLTYSMIGFKKQRKVDYAYGPEIKDTVDLGTIRMTPTALMLKEVEVKASIPRFTMKGDTIVFNPEAFKLKEGARLDELIKKLPGVHKGEDGKLFWNNKPIRLTMNGKDVFGGDNIIGMLPAEAAKKLKVYDRKSELSRHTGKDEGNEDQVLDIQVKPGFLDKWYGQAEAAYITKKRYSANVTASKLSDHDPQMIYAQMNNANRYIDRTMNQSMKRNIDADGKSQYGSYNYQHNWQTKGTAKYDNNRFDISANLGHSDGWGNEYKTTETFFPNTERTFGLRSKDNYDHKLTPQLEARLFAYADSVNTINITAKATYEKKRSTLEDDAATYGYEPNGFTYHSLAEALAAQPGDALYSKLITRNRNYSSSDTETKELFITYAWEHFLGKKGSFKLNGYTYLQGVDLEQTTNRNLEYLREGYTETLKQHYSDPTRNSQTMLAGSINYWLGKKVYVSLEDKVTYLRYKEDRDVTDDAANCLNNLQHSWFNDLTFSSTITPVKELLIMPKLTWNMRHDKSDYQYGDLDTLAIRTINLIDPSIKLRWKMNRERNMDLSFAYTTTAPDLVQTLGYRNTLDPLNVSVGNPNLGYSHSHTTAFNYHRMWLRQQITATLSAAYTKDIHPLTWLFSYNSATGGYQSMPVNVRGGDKWKFEFDYDQGLGAFFRVENQLQLTSTRSYGYMTLIDAAPNTLPALNRQRFLDVRDYLDLSYETDKIQLSVFHDIDWNRYRYTDASYNSSPIHEQVGLWTNCKLGHFEWFFKIADDFHTGYQTGSMNRHRLVANGNVSYKFCKDKCTLTLIADDIFNQDIYQTWTTTAYQRTETAYDSFHHYAQLRFTYRFDAKAKKK